MSGKISKQLTLAALLTAVGGSCDGGGKNPPSQPGLPIPPGTSIAACVPECLRGAIESCHPQGSCVGESSPGSVPNTGEAWICFANGVRVHLIKSFTAGMESTTKVVEENGRLCRTIEGTEGAEGGSFTVKNNQGQEVATLRYSSDMTVTCGGAEYKFDRTSDCGGAVLRLLSPELPLLRSCVPGSCKGP